MANYFRITAYHPKHDVCMIADSNGRFEKLWQFSAHLVQKGFKIIEVGAEEKFLDGNLQRAPAGNQLFIRACAKGKPEIAGNTFIVHGKQYEVRS